MDWNLKALYWDLADVDEATLPNVVTMDHESSRFGTYRTKGDFSVDLKLGQVGNSGNELSAKPKFKDVAAAAAAAGVVSKMTGSPSGSSKRARAISNGTVTVSCLVDGCNSDLSNCRDYHRRHKVCELHSKTPEVTIGGLKQRFCQQCSRFHSLEQFDEGKRSCRKRLDGHNRRRRKPQPEPLTRPGSFWSNYQGTQLLSFSRPHAYPSTTVVNPGWSGGLVTTSCSDARMRNHSQHQQVQLVENQDLFLGSSPTSYKQGKQISFLHNGENPSTATFNNQNPPLPASSICHTLLRTSSLSESGGVRSKMFCDSLTTNSVHDSPCVLSLLSSSQTHTPGNGIINQMVEPRDSMSHMQLQPLGLSLHGSSLESVDRVLVPNGSDHCSSMYNMVSDGSQCNEPPQLFPFQWE